MTNGGSGKAGWVRVLSVGEAADSVQAMRWLLVATGFAWAFRSVLEVFAPQYFHPVTPLDHLAVWAYTVALVLTAPCVIALGRMVPSFIVRVVSICAAVAAFVAGVSNVAEDAFGLPNAGNHYVAGFLVMLGAIVANAVVLAVLRYWRLAAVFAGWTIGIILFTSAGGGLITLVALSIVAARPMWFAAPAWGGSDAAPLDPQ